MSKTEIANNLSASPAQKQASQQIQTISELQSMLASVSGQLSQFQSLTDSQMKESLSRLTIETQSKLGQLQNTMTKQLSETLEMVAADTRNQVSQSMGRANKAAEEALAVMQQEASKAYDEPIQRLAGQVKTVSESTAKISDEAKVEIPKLIALMQKERERLAMKADSASRDVETSKQAAEKARKQAQNASIHAHNIGKLMVVGMALSALVASLVTCGIWLNVM